MFIMFENLPLHPGNSIQYQLCYHLIIRRWPDVFYLRLQLSLKRVYSRLCTLCTHQTVQLYSSNHHWSHLPLLKHLSPASEPYTGSHSLLLLSFKIYFCLIVAHFHLCVFHSNSSFNPWWQFIDVVPIADIYILYCRGLSNYSWLSTGQSSLVIDVLDGWIWLTIQNWKLLITNILPCLTLRPDSL